MTWCSEHGLPHSEFLSWDVDDRAKLVAFLLEKNERCDMCGTAEWEWKENPYAYEPVDHFCQGCYRKSVFTDQEGQGLPGTNVKLIPMTKQRQAENFVRAKRRQEMLRLKED
jgi:hypothetical protein